MKLKVLSVKSVFSWNSCKFLHIWFLEFGKFYTKSLIIKWQNLYGPETGNHLFVALTVIILSDDYNAWKISVYLWTPDLAHLGAQTCLSLNGHT